MVKDVTVLSVKIPAVPAVIEPVFLNDVAPDGKYKPYELLLVDELVIEPLFETAAEPRAYKPYPNPVDEEAVIEPVFVKVAVVCA